MLTRRRRTAYEWVPIGPPSAKRRRASEVTTGDLPEFDLPTIDDVLVSGRLGTPRPLSMKEALGKLGLPHSGDPPDKELIDLLVNAAEIEQGLMIQYLY